MSVGLRNTLYSCCNEHVLLQSSRTSSSEKGMCKSCRICSSSSLSAPLLVCGLFNWCINWCGTGHPHLSTPDRESLINALDSICVWYWQKCFLASDPAEGSCWSCWGCALSWPCLAEPCWWMFGRNCVLWRGRRLIMAKPSVLVKIKSSLLANRSEIFYQCTLEL